MKAAYALKIDSKLRDRVREFCESRGIQHGFCVERALQQYLEHEELLEDTKDLKRLKPEEAFAIGLSTYLARRHA